MSPPTLRLLLLLLIVNWNEGRFLKLLLGDGSIFRSSWTASLSN